MITIPNTISKKYVDRLSASDLREILENASDDIIEQMCNLMTKPTSEQQALAHKYMDVDVYDSQVKLIGDKY